MFINKNISRCETAQKYLCELLNTNSIKSVRIYSCYLANYYKWATTEYNIPIQDVIKSISRESIQDYAKTLAHFNIKTQRQIFWRLRLYIKWLYKKRLISESPRTIIQMKEFSKISVLYKGRKTKKKKGKCFCKLAQKFILEISTTLKPKSISNHITFLNNYYKWMIKEYSIPSELVVKTISRDSVIKYSSTLTHLNPATRYSMLLHLRWFLRWLDENGLLDQPHERIIKKTDFPRKPKLLPQPLSFELDKSLIEYLDNSADVYSKAFLLLRLTGLRISELRTLEDDCIIKINKENLALKVPPCKTQKERLVPLEEKAVKAINFIKQQNTKTNNLNSIYEHLLLSFDGEKVRSYPFFNGNFKAICRAINAPSKTHIHQLRHTYATHLLNAGMDVFLVSKCLGHSDIRMTLHYCNVTMPTIFDQFHKATNKIINTIPASISNKSKNIDAIKSISDVIKLLGKTANTIKEYQNSKILKNNIRRLNTVLSDIKKLNI